MADAGDLAGLGTFASALQPWTPPPGDPSQQTQSALTPAVRSAANAIYPNGWSGGLFGLGNAGLQIANSAHPGIDVGAGFVGMTEPAYHGTPHTFAPTPENPLGAFDFSKMGSGEGAQVYGHGMYLAQRKGIAQHYADTLGDKQSTITFNGKPVESLPYNPTNSTFPDVDQASPEAYVNHLMHGNQGNFKELPKTINAIQKHLDFNKQFFVGSSIPEDIAKLNAYNSAQNWLEQNKSGYGLNSGSNLYTIAVHPEEHEFLDWDKPLSQQSPQVQQNLTQLAIQHGDTTNNIPLKTLLRGNGSDMYHALASKIADNNKVLGTGNRIHDEAGASAHLDSAGIPGIKFLDASSRGGTDTPTSNLVIFHPRHATITHLNGRPVEEVAPPTAGTPP